MVSPTLVASGVSLIVENFPDFIKKIGEANSIVERFGSTVDKQSGISGFFSRALDTIGESFKNIFEIAAGIISAQVITRIADAISSMAAAAFDAAAQFQILGVRLEGLIARDLLPQVGSFAEALEIAQVEAAGLFDWIRDLGVLSPFTVQEIANVFTLAKSYGFASDEAKDLTDAVQNFTAGMGLSDLEMTRIIENLGQMVQQGKITGTELRDLGRGAFVPVNRLLQLTAESLGMVGDVSNVTAKEINAFAASNGLDAVQAFAQSFVQLVNQDFPGAAERMSLTFEGLKSNVIDFLEATIGFEVLGPAFDTITAAAARLFQQFIEAPGVKGFFEQAGRSLNNFVTFLLEKLPPTEEIMENINKAFANMGLALREIERGDLQGAFDALNLSPGIVSTIENIIAAVAGFREGAAEGGLLGGILGGLEAVEAPAGLIKTVEFIQGFFEWIRENGPRIVESVVSFIQDKLIPALVAFGDWAKDNKEIIIGFFTALALGALGISVLATAIGIVSGLISGLVTLLTGTAIAAWILFSQKIQETGAAIRDFITNGISKIREGLEQNIPPLKEAWSLLWNTLKEIVSTKATEIIAAAAGFLGRLLGKISGIAGQMASAGASLMNGLWNGIKSGFDNILSGLAGFAADIVDVIKDALGIKSPSKVFAKMGVDIMGGLAAGLGQGMSLPIAAMEALASAFPGSSGIAFAGGNTVSNVTNLNISMQPTFNNVGGPQVMVDDILAVLAQIRT